MRCHFYGASASRCRGIGGTGPPKPFIPAVHPLRSLDCVITTTATVIVVGWREDGTMPKDVTEVVAECRRVAEAKRVRAEALGLVTTRNVVRPDNGEPRDWLVVNANVRNSAINGGTTEDWLREFGFIR